MIPEFTQELRNLMTHMINGIHTAFPGRIEKYDPEKNLANVQPIMKYKKPNGKLLDYPLLTGVPVWFPQTLGQKATIVYPVKEGDECLVIVSERPIDLWLLGKETRTDLMFDLTEAICIPGLFAAPNPLIKKAVDDEAIICQLEDTYIEIKKDDIRLDSQKTIKAYAKEDLYAEAKGDAQIKADGDVTVDAKGEVNIKSLISITLDAPEINLNGDVNISGDLNDAGSVEAADDVVADGKSLADHTHTDSVGGETSTPN